MIILKHVANLLTHCKLALTEFQMTDADTAGGFSSKVDSPRNSIEVGRDPFKFPCRISVAARVAATRIFLKFQTCLAHFSPTPNSELMRITTSFCACKAKRTPTRDRVRLVVPSALSNVID
jgi:hypothetical protein